MPFSDFLPVQEQENIFLLNSYSDLYLLHIKNDSEVTYTISFNQALRESDVVLYLFDSEKNSVVDQEPVQDIMDFNENDTELCLNLKPSSDYVLTIFNAENYEKLGYTSRIVDRAIIHFFFPLTLKVVISSVFISAGSLLPKTTLLVSSNIFPVAGSFSVA